MKVLLFSWHAGMKTTFMPLGFFAGMETTPFRTSSRPVFIPPCQHARHATRFQHILGKWHFLPVAKITFYPVFMAFFTGGGIYRNANS